MSANVFYKLKRYKSSRETDFASALLLYARNTPANIRTDTNEITYWLDNFATAFKDDFYVFGFYRNKQLVGFAEAAYFRSEKFYALDYIVIDELHRGNNVFYEFIDHLKRYLESEHPEFKYGIAEVTYGTDQLQPSPESSLMIRLLKLQGFRVIHAPYYQPRLEIDDAESEMKADLLIFSNSQIEKLRTETYLSIVKTIYYKYYLRWKDIIPDSREAYKNHLDILYSKIKSGTGKKQSVIVNGHKTVLKVKSKRPILTLHKIISFSLQALVLTILLTAAMLGLKTFFNLSNASFIAVYILAIASFMAVAGIVSKEARDIFTQIVELAKFFFRKKSNDLKPIETTEKPSLPPDPNEQ